MSVASQASHRARSADRDDVREPRSSIVHDWTMRILRGSALFACSRRAARAAVQDLSPRCTRRRARQAMVMMGGFTRHSYVNFELHTHTLCLLTYVERTARRCAQRAWAGPSPWPCAGTSTVSRESAKKMFNRAAPSRSKMSCELVITTRNDAATPLIFVDVNGV